MKKMDVADLYRKPNLSKRHDAHLIYPYLLRPEFDTFEAHSWVTPSNGAGFRAADRQTPGYMDC